MFENEFLQISVNNKLTAMGMTLRVLFDTWKKFYGREKNTYRNVLQFQSEIRHQMKIYGPFYKIFICLCVIVCFCTTTKNVYKKQIFYYL